MTPQDTMQLALESHLKNERHRTASETGYWCKQYKLLARQAIEALAQQGEQQPVAWRMRDTGFRKSLAYRYYTTKEQAEADAAQVWQSRDDGHLTELTPLYAGAAPAVQPLSIEEIEQINAQWNYEIHGDRTRYIARMVEMKHGIGVPK